MYFRVTSGVLRSLIISPLGVIDVDAEFMTTGPVMWV